MAPDSDHGAAAGRGGRGDLMERAVDGAIRLGRAWKALSRERRSAAIAAGVLWLTLFFPWYQASVVSRNSRTHSASPASESLSGWAAFSGVQALILILSLGVILLLFLRAEGRVSHAADRDGWAVTVAGAISVFVVVLGLFNARSPASHRQYVLSTGLEWGIFLALLAAIALTWAGGRMRNSLEEDPILAGRERPRRSPARDPAAASPEWTDNPHAPAATTRATGQVPSGSTSKSPAPSSPSARRSSSAARPVESMTEANRLGVIEPLTDETTATPAGAGQPLTAAGAQSPRPVRAAPSGPDPVVPPSSLERTTEDPAAAEDPTRAAAEDRTVTDPPGPGSRSDWRPAERPSWSDPEHPVGWLTARSGPEETDSEDQHPPRQASAEEPEQLTMPLDPDE